MNNCLGEFFCALQTFQNKVGIDDDDVQNNNEGIVLKPSIKQRVQHTIKT